nr:T9SS type A sorting domain-containing protein [Bacteroidota bacterium]
GIGEVTIGGTPGNFSTNPLLVLSGDHIFIKNIKIKYTTHIGLLIGRNTPRQNNILIDGVEVDRVGNFSMLLRNIDTVLVKNSASYYSSRPGNENLSSPCQWPSGIKFFGSNDCTILDSEIAYSRGEGLNFQNSIRCSAYRNKIYDNPLNVYNDNSSKLMIFQNLIYNSPGTNPDLWQTCPADPNTNWAGTGILIANEGGCMNSGNPSYVNCETVCTAFQSTLKTPNVDSMFVYNNIFQNTGRAIGFWEGVTTPQGNNCIKNVHIFNNTIIGALGMPGAGNNGFVNAFFPSFNIFTNAHYSSLQNVTISRNIFTYDTLTYSNMKPYSRTFHASHPTPNGITLSNNLWIKDHELLGTADEVRNEMPFSTYLLTDSVFSVVPCQQNLFWVKNTTPAFDFLNNDYLGMPRNLNSTNVGALEYNASCKITSAEDIMANSNKIVVFPNPCNACAKLNFTNLPPGDYAYSIYSLLGKEVANGQVTGNAAEIDNSLKGVFVIVLRSSTKQFRKKIILN